MLSLDGVQNQLSLQNIRRLRLLSINNNIAIFFSSTFVLFRSSTEGVMTL